MNPKRIFITLLLACSLQSTAGAQTAAGDVCQINESDLTSASGIVATLHDTLIAIMKDAAALGYQGRYAKVEPIIANHFNTPLIVKTVLGSRYWSTLTDAQQTDFIRLFQQLSIATYADRFDEYDGEQFVELTRNALPLRGQCPPPAGREPPAKRILVKTELRRINDDPVNLEYLQQYIDGKWYVITVIADGVNDLSLKRGEYADVIKKKGYGGLVEEIKIKIKNMETGAAS